MRLHHDLHLAYCTNIHRGESWPETLDALEKHTLEVKRRVCPGGPYAIGLRLGAAAARDLQDAGTRRDFQRWLDRHDCYVFTINGFPYGQFHGTRVKEQVYRPEWHRPERLDYTKALFEVLSDLLPPGVAGSVSTLPGSFKAFAVTPEEERRMRESLRECAGFIARLGDRRHQDLHLGLEPEPLCWLETSTETAAFLTSLGSGEDLRRCLGVNYDTCHLAVEYEEPAAALARFREAGIRISKFHLSSALKLQPSDDALRRLRDFSEDTYLHQTIIRGEDGSLTRYSDLQPALDAVAQTPRLAGEEWRVHFHLPLHAPPELQFADTRDHLCGVLDALAATPQLCQHLEMETYTWGVLPGPLRSADVSDQLAREYAWTLEELRIRHLSDHRIAG
ncbi:MAG: metabolite traffic protein EboE [Verrucomicrobiales bacterium]|nr:metabolite traffic protein EboE [Verrucomicrobiales bacterium]